jgi:hypothetical protein
MVEPLESYCTRFWRRLRKDAAPWARDNIFWGILVLVLPPLSIYLRDRHAQIDWGLIRTTLVLYAVAFAIYLLAHVGRIPKKLDVERDARETILLGRIAEQLETLRTLTEKPKRTPAELNDYETVRKALQVVKEKGITALRHIRKHGSLKFGFYNPVLPPGLTANETLWVYNHCASEGVLTCTEKAGSGERTFAVSPKMDKVLDELLYENEAEHK